MKELLPLVLASASPRRRTLLEAAGIEFTVEPVDVDESLDEFVGGFVGAPALAAETLAMKKARACAVSWRARAAGAAIILAADTIVAAPKGGGWELFGKPIDADDADRMLCRLSQTRHQVVTAVAVIRTEGGASDLASQTTWVTMRAITPSERASYAASREWEGKAGGYAIQETADRFVSALEGDFDNVVGLPVALALRMVKGLGGR